MSTPYVGLKRVFKNSRLNGNSAWVGSAISLSGNAADQHLEVKRRLLQILETQLGVTAIQVGAFQMKLTEEVPERHLIKATHYLLEQMKAESRKSPNITLLEECLVTLLKG